MTSEIAAAVCADARADGLDRAGLARLAADLDKEDYNGANDQVPKNERHVKSMYRSQKAVK